MRGKDVELKGANPEFTSSSPSVRLSGVSAKTYGDKLLNIRILKTNSCDRSTY